MQKGRLHKGRGSRCSHSCSRAMGLLRKSQSQLCHNGLRMCRNMDSDNCYIVAQHRLNLQQRVEQYVELVRNMT